VGPTPFEATLSGPLRFGAAGDSLSGLVATLGGAGDWRVTGLRAPNADPSAFERALKRVLADNEPLVEGKAEAILGTELGRGPLTAPSVTTSAALVGGLLRLSPFTVDAGPAVWQGSVAYDLKTLALDARGFLTAKTAPAEWVGAPPSLGLTWSRSLSAPAREIDAGPFRNGVAAIVVKRELEKIEAFEKAASERQRQFEAQQEAERQRARAAAEEAARQSRQRAEAERARFEAERLQSQQQRQPAEERTPPPPLSPVQEIRPPPAINGG
jgi:hypothetical protein